MIKSILRSFYPAPLNTKPKEWLRASVGACVGVLTASMVCQYFYGIELALHLLGPIGASSVLLFAVSTGALAQPWSIVGSYFVATGSALIAVYLLGHSILSASFAVGLAIGAMCIFRCLHPPGGAVALCIVLSQTDLAQLGFYVFYPVMLNAGILLCCALVFNNLTLVRYPKMHTSSSADINHTNDIPPFERVGFNSDDLDAALSDIGEFVDVTREDLEGIIRSTEKHALRRSMGDIQASHIMSKDVLSGTPETTIKEAIRLLMHHSIKSLPILDSKKHIVGIVSLTDIIKYPASIRNSGALGLFGFKKNISLSDIMHTSVTCVTAAAHIVELIPLLSRQGLHCIPVLQNNEFVGVVTQTDLIAALHRDLMVHLH
ncbi:HPP family protein [Pseudomonas sp. CCI1.2]|uniref:HPP family protein n=1 Tax=Pseudomonas sp. CCI1.2 TaxID=3048614 RepID=UPI002B22711C|nr:HPP family protein [Pseudomonas sp. CCI1.2]MEB0121593.1 HPP family protein [Pseudomonas sp. CCI1.2]